VNAGSDRIRTVGSKPYYRTRYALATLLHSRYSDRSAFLDHIPRGSAQWMPFGFGTLIVNTDTAPTLSNDPLTDSLFGEYARMLLVGTAGCSAPLAARHRWLLGDCGGRPDWGGSDCCDFGRR